MFLMGLGKMRTELVSVSGALRVVAVGEELLPAAPPALPCGSGGACCAQPSSRPRLSDVLGGQKRIGPVRVWEVDGEAPRVRAVCE